MKRLVLLGGGHAHVHVLQAFARDPLPGAEVMLVTPFERQMYSGMVPGLVAGHYTAAQCAIALVPLAAAARVLWVQGAAVGLDTAARRVRLADGRSVEYDLLSLDTGAEAPAWLAGSGLALDERGFVLTGATLQSRSNPEVFAVGDVATREDAPHARSGVYAVRAGPPLALNLRRRLGGGVLQPYRPQQRTLNLISCGDKRAIAAWGGWSAQGRWVWWWKDRIDRGFVARYSAPPRGGPAARDATRSA